MNDSPPRPPGHRLWFPIGVGVLAFAGILLVRLQPELETNLKAWFTSGILILALLLTLVWFVLLSRIRWGTRLAVVALLGLGIVGARQFLRVDGTVDGSGLPRFVWNKAGNGDTPLSPSPALVSEPAPAASSSTPQAASVAEAPGVLDTPQFMGPARDGVLRGSNLSRDWKSSPPRELWRQPIGSGWSAFAVVGPRALTQEQHGEEEWVSCYELRTGRLLWAHTNHVRFFQWQGGAGPRATPTVDRDRVFAIGGTGILDCLEAGTGRRVWSRDVLKEHDLPNLLWGVSGSPLVFDDTVVVTGGLTNRSTVLAYHRETGQPVWQSGLDKASYAAPILTTLAGRRVVLSVNASSLTGHDPATGILLLEHPWSLDKWPKASQPVVLEGDRVFLSAGYGMGCLMLHVTATVDGRLAAEELWRNKMMKTQFNSAAVRNGFIYGLDDGLLACVDAETGKRQWKDGRYGSGQSLIVDDLILIQSEAGPVVLADASPEGFVEHGRIAALSSKTWNFPTLAGRYLLVRNDLEAVCYELPVNAPTTVAASTAIIAR